MKASWKRLCVLLYDRFTALDAFGPADVLCRIEGMAASFLSLKGGMVASSQGIRIATDALDPLDGRLDGCLLLLPRGFGSRAMAQDEAFLAALRQACARAGFVLAVCTGSALLARAGLLEGRRAATNALAFDWAASLGGGVHWVRGARWVQDGAIYTSAGVSAGIDMALGFVSGVYGDAKAREICRSMSYRWNRGAPAQDGSRLRLRPFRPEDAETVASWSRRLSADAFYAWNAGRLGPPPLTGERLLAALAGMAESEDRSAFLLLEDARPAGFLTLHPQGEGRDALRLGLLLVDPPAAGRGLGRRMLERALHYAFEVWGASRVSPGVFEHRGLPGAAAGLQASGRTERLRPASCPDAAGSAWRWNGRWRAEHACPSRAGRNGRAQAAPSPRLPAQGRLGTSRAGGLLPRALPGRGMPCRRSAFRSGPQPEASFALF